MTATSTTTRTADWEEGRGWMDDDNDNQEGGTITKKRGQVADTGATISAAITPRIQAFLRSVIFVHTHNIQYRELEEVGEGVVVCHKVALNRSSDMLSHELPLMSSNIDVYDASTTAATATVMSNGDIDYVKPT